MSTLPTERILRTTRAASSTASALLLAVLLAAGQVAAQQTEPPQPETDEVVPQTEDATEFGSWQMPGWSFTPSVAVGLSHDSNVALSSPRADQTGTQGASLLSLVPNGSLRFAGARTNFSAAYGGSVRRYFDLEGVDTYNHRASADIRHAVTRRWNLFAMTMFAESPTTDLAELNGVPFRRTGSRRTMYSAGTSVRLTKLVTLKTRYDGTWVSFERPDEFLRSGWVHGLGADVGRALSSRISVGGEYAYRWATLDEDQRRMTFQDAGGFVRVVLGPHTTGSAAAGVATLQDRNIDVTRQGPYFRLGLAHQLAYARVGASFQRQYVPSFGFGGSTGSHQLRAYALLPLTPVGIRRASLQGSIAWQRTQPFEQSSLQSDALWLRSSIGYLVTRLARLEGYYAYRQYDSIVTGGEVDRHMIGIQFVISQPMRLQ